MGRIRNALNDIGEFLDTASNIPVTAPNPVLVAGMHIVPALDAIQNVASSKADFRFKRALDQIGAALKAHDMVLMVDPEGNYGVEIRD